MIQSTSMEQLNTNSQLRNATLLQQSVVVCIKTVKIQDQCPEFTHRHSLKQSRGCGSVGRVGACMKNQLAAQERKALLVGTS